MIYGFLSGSDVTAVGFRPSGVDEKAARTLRQLVAEH
jgi:hypothetical protein